MIECMDEWFKFQFKLLIYDFHTVIQPFNHAMALIKTLLDFNQILDFA